MQFVFSGPEFLQNFAIMPKTWKCFHDWGGGRQVRTWIFLRTMCMGSWNVLVLSYFLERFINFIYQFQFHLFIYVGLVDSNCSEIFWMLQIQVFPFLIQDAVARLSIENYIKNHEPFVDTIYSKLFLRSLILSTVSLL